MKSSFSGSSSNYYSTWPPRAGLPAPKYKIPEPEPDSDVRMVPRYIVSDGTDPDLPEPEPELLTEKSELNVVKTAPEPTEAESCWFEEQMKRSEQRIVFTITVLITPALAGLLLLQNNINRPFLPNSKDYRGIMRDIEAGTFDHNGETVKVAYTRQLNDGQHRLHAIIDTGIPILTEVTFGLKPETRLTVDRGRIRTIGGQLSIIGHPDGNNLANAAARIMTYEKVGRFTLLTATLRPTMSEVQLFCKQHDLTTYMVLGRVINNKVGVKSGLSAALYYIIAKVDAVAAAKFFNSLAVGSETAGPIYKLRELLNAEGRRPKALKMSDYQIADIVIQAWNAWRQGRSPRSFKPAETGQGYRVPFPKPI